MKQPHERVEEGLHPIENEKRPRAVAKKRGGLRLKAKYHRRVTKVLASFSAAAVLCLGVFGVNALFFQDTAPNVVDEGFVTVAYDLPTDGSTPDAHTALENIGYMNTRLMGQDNYYNEMHGLVDTMIKQEVSTYKQFSDGVLIQTDITTSSMVNSARQFCYVGDRVLWRDAAGGPSTYNGVDTVWKDGEPYGNTLIEDFKKRNGLPGTSFSVYVINEETLLGADPVVVNADGTYTQTYYLDPATDKAPAYYVNQMMFTGGLTALPSFEQITVTYTFDSTWQVLQSVISETYTATMGVSVGCTASYTTNYEYDTEKALSDAYDTYFKDYADKPATGAPDGETVTAAACLSNAFAPVLSGPVTFSLDLAIDGASVSGLVYVDAADMADMELRAQLGNLYIGYADGQIRLAYGDGVKVGAGTEELLALLRSFLPEGGNGGISLDTDELLAQLGGGDFAVSDDGRSATLDSTLGLMGISLPVHFEFLIAEDGTISLGHISADISPDGTEISARLAYSDESVPAKEGEYADLIPYAETMLGIMDSDVLAVSVDYAGNGFSVGGTLNVNISDLNDLSAQGTLALSVGGAQKKIGIAYTGGYAYIDLDGVKIRANAEEAIALVMQFIGGELPAVGTGDFALGDLLTTLLSDEFASNISLSEKENVLEVVLAGNELLKALGVDLGGFALGNVELSVSDGMLSVNVLGAQLSVTAGKEFSADTEGYTDILPMVNELIALFGNENLQASVNYAAGDLTAEGTIRLNVNTLAAAGELTLGYKGKIKAVGVIYGDGELGLDIDGIKVKANVEEAVSLITDLLGAEGGLSAEEDDLLGKLLSLDFGSLIGFENESSVVVKGTELLKAIGIDFALGDVRLTVKDGALTAEVLGATATVTGAEAFEAVITDEYTDILPYADALIAFFTDAEYLRAEIAYAAGELSAEGYVNLSLKELAVQGEVTIDYRGAGLAVGLIYQDGALYLNVNGLKVKANAEEAISLVAELLGADGKGFTQEEADILETLFSLDLGKLIGLNDTNVLTVNVKGTELLKAFGIDFELGDVSLTVSSEEIAANVLGAQLSVTKTTEFSADTEGYTDILPMVNELIALFGNENLQASVNYAAGDLTAEGTIRLNVNTFAAAGELTLGYKGKTKAVGVIYGDGELGLDIDGIKVKANVEEAVSLITDLLGAEGGLSAEESDLLGKLLSLDFGSLIDFENESSVVVKGTELLKAFGIDFALGDVRLTVKDGALTAEVLGATATVTGAEAFEAVITDEYTDILPYADALIAFFTDAEYLRAEIAYAAGELSAEGYVNLSLKELAVQGEVTIDYRGAGLAVGLIYQDGALYLNVNGLKVKANAEEAISLVAELLGADGKGFTQEEADILETLFSLDLGKLIGLNDTNVLTVNVKGTELLKAFGIDFELGDVSLTVSSEEIAANVLGAQLSVTKTTEFSADTEGYTDILPMVNELIALFGNENLQASVNYAAGDLTAEGTIRLNVNTLAAAGELTLGYKGKTKAVGVIYGDGELGLDIDGIKVKANVEEAVSLIADLLGAEGGLSAAEGDLLGKLLSLDFGSLIGFENESSVVVKGTELLKAIGIDFALGDVRLTVKDGALTAEVLGATATVTGAEAFEAVITDEYTDILPYADALIAFFTDAEYLRAEIAYAAGELSAEGYVNLSLKELAVQGEVTIDYRGAGLAVGLIYQDGALYLNVNGLKVKANAEEAISLVAELLGADGKGFTQEEADILETLFSLDLGKIIGLDDTNALTVNVKGTELLKAFGIDFELGDVSLTVSSEEIAASALGAKLSVTKTTEFSADTEGYTDILPMVNELIALFGNENLQASVNYAAGDLTAEGTIRLNVNTLAAAGELTLGYKGKTKAVGVIYGDGELGLDIDGIKVKANVEEAVSLIADLLGAEGGLSAEESDLLGKLLSLDFGSLIDFENESSVVVKGTELLKAFGIDFALGDVRLTVKDGALTAEVLGATATVTGAEAFEAVITDEYTDILPYADALIAFFTDAEYLRAEIAYAAGELSAEGYVNLSLKELAVQGEVTIDYRGAGLAVGLIYQDGALYLNVNGLKVKANAEEAISLVAELLGADGKGFTQEEADILETLFSLDLGKIIGLDDTNALTVNVKGTELLKAFGIDFELGDVSLTVSSEEIAASALGAKLSVTKTTEFSVDTEGYTDILPMAETILGIVADGGVDAQVQFTAGQVSLLADVSVSLENLAVKGSLTVSYTDGSGSAAKKIDFAYGEEGYVYLTLEGAKLKLNAADAAGLVSSAIGTQDGSDISAILKKLFSLDLGEIIRFKSETSAVIGGTQLLEALGVDFALGDIAIGLQDGKLTAEVQGEDALLGGLRVTLAAGSAFAVDASEYADHADITPVLDTVLAVMENKALALSGTLSVGYKDFAASVSVQNGTVSWKDGFRLSLDLIVTAGETAQKIGVYADETRVTIVYGSVGVDLVYDELYQVGNAFEAAYERISAILSNYVKGAQIPATLGELSALAGAGAAVTDLLAGLDIPQIIDGVSFGAPEKGGVASVAYGNIRAELFVSRGAVSVNIGKVSLGEAAFSGSLTAGVSDGAVTQPSGSYMTAESLCELLDFVGAAAATLSSNDVRISFNDSVSVNADGSAKFEIDGELVYHAGNAGETFFTLDTAAQSLVVNPEAYVYFTLWLDEVAADGTDLYLQFWMFDYEQDGELDFFISLSKYQPEDSRYKPLNFAVSASDLMTIAASGVSLMEDTLADFLTTLGFPEETTAALFETLDSYFVSKWLSDDEQGQFGAVGGMLASTLGIKDAVEGILGDVSDAITGETVLADMPFDYYLKELGVSSENGETVFTVTLDSDLVYGGEGLDDLTVMLRKNGEAGSSFLSGISVANIYGAGNADKTSVNFDIGYDALTLGYTESGITLSAGDAQVASLNYADYSNYMFEGADELLKSIALSATHKTDDGYALNGNFFISGSAEVVIDLTLFEIPAATVTVNGLSVSVDENGELTINASITFPKVIIAINEGGTTDITVKQGMVYLRRTIGSDVKYRVLTLESFFADIMDHVIFMFNFSDTVADAMRSGGSSETTPETDDYGTVLSDVLSSYSYRQGEQGSEWVLNFNGSALTGGVLGDMQLTLASSNYAGTDNVLRTLNFRTSLSILKVDATLTFHNPCDISDGTQDPTADLSDQIPDLYTVTIIAPCALGSSWEKNEDGTYSVSVQMFADSAISLVYGENTYTFRVTGENCVFDLTAIEGLPQNMLWEEGTFEYTADDSSIRVPLAPDTVTYRSSGVNFTLGGAENVSETTVEFDGTYTLETPAAEGYTFLGWYVLDENGNPVRVTEISYSVVGGANTTVEALWASNIQISATASDVSDGWLGMSRKYSSEAKISGGSLYGLEFDDNLTIQTTYNFHLTGGALNRTYNKTHQGYVASDSCSFGGEIMGGKRFEITVSLTYCYTYTAADGSQQTIELGTVSQYTEQGW